ncbi:sigma-54-dependent transcriptional regulator [Planctomycetota bacterium]
MTRPARGCAVYSTQTGGIIVGSNRKPPAPKSELANPFLITDPEGLFEYQRQQARRTGIWGLSAFTCALRQRLIPEIAASGLRVLVTGETGTGKELAVRAIADAAQIPMDRLVCVNCAAIAPNIVEREIFGNVAGAYTDARRANDGYLHEADGGAIFLDEIGVLPEHTQAKLLRVIEEGKFYRVGSSKPDHIDARFYAATKDEHTVLEDLRWRFAEHVHLPPLRERVSDVFTVLQGILDEERGRRLGKQDARSLDAVEWVLLPETVVHILFSLWRGNFRELRNAAYRALGRWQGGEQPLLFDYLPVSDSQSLLRDRTHWTALKVWEAMVEDAPAVRVASAGLSPAQLHGMGNQLLLRDALAELSSAGAALMVDQYPPRVRASSAMTLAQAIQFVCGVLEYRWDEVFRKESGSGAPWTKSWVESHSDSLLARLHVLDAEKGVMLRPVSSMLPRKSARGPKTKPSQVADSDVLQRPFSDVEHQYFETLRANHPTLKAAAEASGIKPSTLSGRLKRLGISGYRTRIRDREEK